MRKPVNLLALGLVCGLGLARAEESQVERGRYLVEEVGKCQECHTPRNANREPDRTRWMKGATLDFQPMQAVEGWHSTAPDLTPSGRLWKNWGESSLLKYLETGLTPKGRHAGPPMPTYKLKPEDAAAVVAYLKSLK